ncbi:subtilisin-like protease-like protein [Corchorus olitorius]|uniref:Subtilisin-like protease-like protein n=1 Tax=Corchorus olitorius TaxID=93759 RepID=A0A1R3HLR1_9ROSI|nr:subtilisin-like protease-like protein [Corchorus olitorius]
MTLKLKYVIRPPSLYKTPLTDHQSEPLTDEDPKLKSQFPGGSTRVLFVVTREKGMNWQAGFLGTVPFPCNCFWNWDFLLPIRV